MAAVTRNPGQTGVKNGYDFRKCVNRYQGNYKTKKFQCRDQYLCMAFAQLTYRESLRDIEACLRAVENKLYHMGFRSTVSRNTLANANEQRDWRIYQQTFIDTYSKVAQCYERLADCLIESKDYEMACEWAHRGFEDTLQSRAGLALFVHAY